MEISLRLTYSDLKAGIWGHLEFDWMLIFTYIKFQHSQAKCGLNVWGYVWCKTHIHHCAL